MRAVIFYRYFCWMPLYIKFVGRPLTQSHTFHINKKGHRLEEKQQLIHHYQWRKYIKPVRLGFMENSNMVFSIQHGICVVVTYYLPENGFALSTIFWLSMDTSVWGWINSVNNPTKVKYPKNPINVWKRKWKNEKEKQRVAFKVPFTPIANFLCFLDPIKNPQNLTPTNSFSYTLQFV